MSSMSISMAKGPALTLLYGLLTVANLLLSVSHYLMGYYDIVLIHLTSVAVYGLTALFMYLSTTNNLTHIINMLSLTCIAVILQYQLYYQPELTVYWLYSFPIISYFVLPMLNAAILNTAVLVSSLIQLWPIFGLETCIGIALIYVLIGMCSLCYAYLNTLRQKHLLTLAVTDYLSGAYNIRHLQHQLVKEIARSYVTHRTLSLLALTIDDYQQIVDIHGRHQGSKLLKQFKAVLTQLLRAGDDIFHDGKGTFYLLLPNCPSEGVIVLKERLSHTLKGRQWGEVGELQLNTGIATLKDNETAEQFLARTSQHIQQQQQTTLRLLAFK